jgi:hypothetical protein
MIALRAIPAAAALVAMLAAPAFAVDSSAYFIGLEDGATVSSPLTVRFELSGMGVAPAGMEKENTYHHHLLIDRAAWGQGPDDTEYAGNGRPADDHIRHFGGGQTEVTVTLAPGVHTLQMVMGDAYHVPMAATSAQISVTLK